MHMLRQFKLFGMMTRENLDWYSMGRPYAA